MEQKPSSKPTAQTKEREEAENSATRASREGVAPAALFGAASGFCSAQRQAWYLEALGLHPDHRLDEFYRIPAPL